MPRYEVELVYEHYQNITVDAESSDEAERQAQVLAREDFYESIDGWPGAHEFRVTDVYEIE